MAGATRPPNRALAALLDEAGWTNAQFAAAVNRLAPDANLRLNYDKSAVAHWLTGTRPVPRARPLVCEALARRLGRPITEAAAGFGPAPQTDDDGCDSVTKLIELGSADMDPTRRAALGAIGIYSVALAIPGWPEVTARFNHLKTNPHVRIGTGEVEAVRAMTDHLSTLDDQFGGAAVRPLAAAFLVNTIAPYLHADANHTVRAQMLAAASDHCYLTGYMAMDERADGLAQRYYLLALELAGHAGDHLTYCTTLRGMSVQAVDLRHTTDAVQLAEAASAAAPNAGPRMLAFLAGQHAHAAAQAGDRAQALAQLKAAEKAMDRAESRSTALGSYDPSSLHYHIAQVRYELGDREQSIDELDKARRLRPDIYRRTHVRHLGTLAERKLEIGHLEDACGHWHRMLDGYLLVQSGRCDDRFRIMLDSIRRYNHNRYARDLYERAKSIARQRQPRTPHRAI
jgi:tetratricopeptide (TPR) repeat protein